MISGTGLATDFEQGSARHDDPVLNLTLFVFGKQVQAHSLVRIGVGPLRNDAMGSMRIKPR